MPCRISTRIALAGLVLIGLGAVRNATASYTYAGFTFDQANSARTATVVQGTFNTSNPADNTKDIFVFSTTFNPGTGFDLDRTVGSLLAGPTAGLGRSANLGNSTNRGEIELTFGSLMGLANLSGNDLLVYENGSANAPEFFEVAVRIAGESTFSSFLRRNNSGFEAPVFATAFDLSDFGVSAGQLIDAVRIRNILAREDSSLDPNSLDPDITYVVGLHDLRVVPEPSSLLLAGLGLTGLAAWGFRRRRLATPRG